MSGTDDPAHHPAPSGTPEMAGCPPGTVGAALYLDGCRQPAPSLADALDAAAGKPSGFVWLGLHEPPPAAVESLVGADPLLARAVLRPGRWPRVRRYGGTAVLTARTAWYRDRPARDGDAGDVVGTGRLTLVLTERSLATVRHGEARPLADPHDRLRADAATLAGGPWAVAHAILARLVDDYAEAVSAVEDDVARLEEAVFDPRGRADLAGAYQLKREMIELRHAVAPLRHPLSGLVTDHDSPVPGPLRRRYARLAAELVAVTDRLAALEDLLHTLLLARLTQIGIEQNDRMRQLAAWAAILAVETVITGIYGMRFDHLPPSTWYLGYPLTLVVMAAASIGLYAGFRRSGWLPELRRRSHPD